ncbi:Schlafen AAA domain, partial [Trinorchestia longiramus]
QVRPPPHVVADRHYILHSTLQLQEDARHEFKGHCNISIYDIPMSCFNQEGVSRNSVSASVCGLLNAGTGGIILLGVSDGACVLGVPLTLYQRDHVTTALSYTLSRYSPPVPPSEYSVCFVP